MIAESVGELDCAVCILYNESMQNKVYLDDQGVIVIEVVGDQTVASVEQMGQEVEKLIDTQRKAGKPCLVLDNLFRIGEVGPEARHKVVELTKTLAYDRAAMTGKGGMMRFGANLMLRATGRANTARFFESEQEARQWLQSPARG
jgi:hypothetical protein